MSYLPPDEINPFQAPEARIGDYGTDMGELDRGADAEIIRRDLINHEVSIKTLGILCYILAVFGGIGTIGLLIAGSGLVPLNLGNQADPGAMSPQLLQGLFLGGAVFYLVLTVLYAFIGYGLRRLQVWARWTVIVLTSLFLLYILVVSLMVAITQPVAGLVFMVICGLIPIYIVFLMASPKASMVFSAEYQDVIRKTPHVKARTSLLLKVVLVLLVVVILFIIVAALSSR